MPVRRRKTKTLGQSSVRERLGRQFYDRMRIQVRNIRRAGREGQRRKATSDVDMIVFLGGRCIAALDACV
jgi:hypothetical protein